MRTTLAVLVALGAVVSVGALLFLTSAAAPASGVRPPAGVYEEDEVAANGVVEGARPEVALRPEVAGTLARLAVRENHQVAPGAVLAELRNDAQKAHLALAQAELDQARAQLERLQNGERPERRKALAAVASARQASYLQTKAEYDRARQLETSRGVSQEQLEAAYYKMLRAKAEWQEAKAEHALAEAPARADEVKAAKAKVAAEKAHVELARAELAKTVLRAPCGGCILQVYAEPGEAVGPASAQPVLLLANLSRRRVRAFVEELDVAKVRVGQPARVTADGLAGKEFGGTVAVVLPRMGKRAPQSDAPGEYKDVYFREVLIELDHADPLPTNLRVHVRIRAEPAK
jgi:multidrug resistance efflux pump